MRHNKNFEVQFHIVFFSECILILILCYGKCYIKHEREVLYIYGVLFKINYDYIYIYTNCNSNDLIFATDSHTFPQIILLEELTMPFMRYFKFTIY